MNKSIVGVDEAGRGPLAGPVSVGAVVVPHDFDWSLLEGVNDSKKLSPKKRELLFELTKNLKKEGLLNYAVSMVGSTVIDTKGITFSVKTGIIRSLKRLDLDVHETHVKLDGLLIAPKEFIYQETIIGGDAIEKSIGLASIMAKVTRDRYMERLAKRDEALVYDFHLHKGYGTKAHCAAIRKYGLLKDIHRKSFCKNLSN